MDEPRTQALDVARRLLAEGGRDLAVAYAQVAQVEALERIADRLDSWTHDPDDHATQVAARKAAAQGRELPAPVLRVRRW